MFLKKSDMKIKSDGLPDNNAKTIQVVHVSSKHFTFFGKKNSSYFRRRFSSWSRIQSNFYWLPIKQPYNNLSNYEILFLYRREVENLVDLKFDIVPLYLQTIGWV
jgi:hypothetical protein